jgi:hypothetical protein
VAETGFCAAVQIAILKDCRNVHVVQFLGACMHPGCTMLITELMAANAQDLIHSGKLPWREKCAPLYINLNSTRRCTGFRVL